MAISAGVPHAKLISTVLYHSLFLRSPFRVLFQDNIYARLLIIQGLFIYIAPWQSDLTWLCKKLPTLSRAFGYSYTIFRTLCLVFHVGDDYSHYKSVCYWFSKRLIDRRRFHSNVFTTGQWELLWAVAYVLFKVIYCWDVSCGSVSIFHVDSSTLR